MNSSDEKPMSYVDREECLQLRCKGKRGIQLTPEEMKKCERWMKQYPKQYQDISREAFILTAPFGMFNSN